MSTGSGSRFANLAAEGRLLNASGKPIVLPNLATNSSQGANPKKEGVAKPTKQERKLSNRGKKRSELVPLNSTVTVAQPTPAPPANAWANAIAPRAMWSTTAANQQPATAAHAPSMFVYVYLTHEGNLPLHYDAAVYNRASRPVGEMANIIHDVMYKINSSYIPNSFLEFIWSVWGNFFRSAFSSKFVVDKKVVNGKEMKYPKFEIDPFLSRFACKCEENLPRMATHQSLHVNVSRTSEGKKEFLNAIVLAYDDEIHQLEACCDMALKRNIVNALRITCTKDTAEGSPSVETINKNIDALIVDLTTIAKYVGTCTFEKEDAPSNADINYTDISLMQDRIYGNLRVNDRTNLFNFRTRHLQNAFVCSTTSKDGVEVLRRARRAVFSKIGLLFAHRISSVRVSILDANSSIMCFKDEASRLRPANDDVHIPLRSELAVHVSEGFEMSVAQVRVDVMSEECRLFGGFFPTLEWYLELDGIRDDTHSKASVIRDMLIKTTGYPPELFRTNVGDYGIEFMSGHPELEHMMEKMETSRKAMKVLIRIIKTLEEHLNARCTEPHMMRITFIYKCKRTIFIMAPYVKQIHGLSTGAIATFKRCITANWADLEEEEIEAKLAADVRSGNSGYLG